MICYATISLMKIISLNTWGGLAGKDLLLSFFRKYKDDVDVFCLQEIWDGPHEDWNKKMPGGRNLEHDKIMINGKQEISKILPNYTVYFRPHLMDHYGLLMFVREDLKVLEEGEFCIQRKGPYAKR